MTCLFSNDFSNATKSSNLAVRHFKGEGSPPPLRPTRVCSAWSNIWSKMILTFASHLPQSDITIKIYLVESQPRLVAGFNRKCVTKSNGKKGEFLLPGFVVDVVQCTSFVKASNCLWRVILTKCHPSIKLPLTYPNLRQRVETENVIQFN